MVATPYHNEKDLPRGWPLLACAPGRSFHARCKTNWLPAGIFRIGGVGTVSCVGAVGRPRTVGCVSAAHAVSCVGTIGRIGGVRRIRVGCTGLTSCPQGTG